MESFQFQDILEKAPSPSLSDDSGFGGMSPNPLYDGKHYLPLESPPDSDFVTQSLVESTEDSCAFNTWPYNTQGANVTGISHIGDQPSNTDDKSPDLSENFNLEKFWASLMSNTTENKDKSSRKKLTTKSDKRITANQTTKQTLKLERCLQPKTGNCKPRQTSTKRKMNPNARIGKRPYPGVRPKTVRESLEQMRQSGKAKHDPQPQVQRPVPFPRSTAPQQNLPFPPQAYHPNLSSPVGAGYAEQMEPVRSVDSPLSHRVIVPSPMSSYSATPPPSYVSSTESSQDFDFFDSGYYERIVQPQRPFAFDSVAPSAPQQVAVCSEPDVMQSIRQAQSAIEDSPEYLSPTPFPDPSYTPQNSFPNSVFHEVPGAVATQNYMPSPDCYTSCSYVPSPQTYDSSAPVDAPSFWPSPSTVADNCYPWLHELAANGNLQQLAMHLTQIRANNMMPSVESLVNQCDGSGMTPLLYAIKMDHLDVAEHLLFKCGADPIASANDGQNVLHFAAALKHSKMMDFLCRNIQNLRVLIDGAATVKGGRTPLHIATQSGNVQNMIILMQNGASLVAQEKQNGWTALHMAVKNADVVATREILTFAGCGTFSSDPLIHQRERNPEALRKVACQTAHNDNTALHFAAELQVNGGDDSLRKAQSMLVNLLLDNEANRSSRNHQNQLPLSLLSSGNAQLQDRLKNPTSRSMQPPRHPGQLDLANPPLPFPSPSFRY